MRIGIERLGAEVRGNIKRAVKAGMEPWRAAGEIGQKAIKMFVNPQDCVLQLEASKAPPTDQTLRGLDYYLADEQMRQLGQQRLCETALGIIKSTTEEPPETDLQKLQKISTALGSMPRFSVNELSLEPEDAVVMSACIYAFSE